MHFSTVYQDILDRIDQIDPKKYARTRNYVDGAVTYLSPYISRGVISTDLIFKAIQKRGFDPLKIEKFVQELAWRDYWQLIWVEKGNDIDHDLKFTQSGVQSHQMPEAVLNADIGISAIDEDLKALFDTGYMHNHMRMYVAGIICPIAKYHWKTPAQWMYYHLLDGDWASNALSWQWVAGTTRSKVYFANQDNINKYWHTQQKGTFLDKSYDAISKMDRPEVMAQEATLDLSMEFPKSKCEIDPQKETYLYNWYNMDPLWSKDKEVNRVLLMEPEVFAQYPISKKSMDFLLGLRINIENIQTFVGSFTDFKKEHRSGAIHYKEHPLNGHYEGIEEPRDWMFSVKGYHTSFFSFWKKCKKDIKSNQLTFDF